IVEYGNAAKMTTLRPRKKGLFNAQATSQVPELPYRVLEFAPSTASPETSPPYGRRRAIVPTRLHLRLRTTSEGPVRWRFTSHAMRIAGACHVLLACSATWRDVGLDLLAKPWHVLQNRETPRSYPLLDAIIGSLDRIAQGPVRSVSTVSRACR
ncbi:hypothetical protein JI435_161890, partial [Parastagonospora nodorum SN15]